MDNRKVVTSLIWALEQKMCVAVRFAARHNCSSDGFLDEVKSEALQRIQSGATRNYDPSKGSPGPYVGQIVYRVCVRLFNQRCKRPRHRNDVEAYTDELRPTAILARRELLAEASQALAQLSEEDRRVISDWSARSDLPTLDRPKRKYSTLAVRESRARERFLKQLLLIRSRQQTPPSVAASAR
jgi:DNA-directed RNA polymerase specialized sigma24 family protein